MVCAESGKEAVREHVVVMSSPGVQEKGQVGGCGTGRVYSAERDKQAWRPDNICILARREKITKRHKR